MERVNRRIPYVDARNRQLGSQVDQAIMVCFDLGGVLAKICQTWQEAATRSGSSAILPVEPLFLEHQPTFRSYQAGELGLDEYVVRLAEDLSISPAEALRLHESIIVEEEAGAHDLVQELLNQGIRLGCLSNTNAAHWEILCCPQRFPSIAAIPHKLPSHECRLDKPSEAIFRHFETTFQAHPGEIWFFDDSKRNIEGATAAGWRAVWIDHREAPVQQVRAVLKEAGVL